MDYSPLCLLSKYVLSAMKGVRYLACTVRPFDRTEDTVKLFCLNVWTPTSKMVNEAFEAALDGVKFNANANKEESLVSLKC